MSDKFNLHLMRRLFNPGRSIKRVMGEQRRKPFKTTLTTLARTALEETVPTGKGKYAAATIELSLRFMLALVGSLSIKEESETLAIAVTDPEALIDNLHEAIHYIDLHIENTDRE